LIFNILSSLVAVAVDTNRAVAVVLVDTGHRLAAKVRAVVVVL